MSNTPEQSADHPGRRRVWGGETRSTRRIEFSDFGTGALRQPGEDGWAG